MNNISFSNQIKKFALSIGFDACGICKAEKVGVLEELHFKEWINNNKQAEMDYLTCNSEKRLDTRQLIDNAKSIISVALNYYPQQKQPESLPQIAYYAYGKDYHDVLKNKLQQLLLFIQEILPNASGRVFCDTAPILERYWAAKAGLGFVGKNTLLIIPKKGSYFFLGEIIINETLDYDKPLNISCGKCSRCLDGCPTVALERPYLLDSNKCISYLTIENKGEIADNIKPKLSNRFYGCDICQQVCPWNKFAVPHNTSEFIPNLELLTLDRNTLEEMSIEDYQRIFKGSAMKRAKYFGLKRNIKALENFIR